MSRKPDKKKLIAFILAAVLIIAAMIGWSAWRKHVTTQQAQEKAAIAAHQAQARERKYAKKKKQAKTQVAAMPETDKNQLIQTAITFEHASRDWGVDPNTLPSETQLNPADVINTIRTPDSIDHSGLDQVSTIQPKPEWGPTGPSVYCAVGNQGMCATYPQALTYWNQQHWTMGARINNTPNVTVTSSTTVTVKGQVATILWSDTQGEYSIWRPTGSAWELTPVTGIQHFEDKLTIENGKVTRRTPVTPTEWLADPWYQSWKDNPAASTASWDKRKSWSIPVSGDIPDLGLHQDPGTVILKNEQNGSTPTWDNIIDSFGDFD